MKLSTVLEGIKAVASFGAGLIVAHECNKHDVPMVVTTTASCSTTAVTYKVLSVVSDYVAKEEKESEDIDLSHDYNESLFTDEEEIGNADITNYADTKSEIVQEQHEESIKSEAEAAPTEETVNETNNEEKNNATSSESNNNEVKEKEAQRQKAINDDMILAKQSLSAAEKKELEKETMEKKQPSRPVRR